MTTLMTVAEVTNVPADLGEEGSMQKEMNNLPHPPFRMEESRTLTARNCHIPSAPPSATHPPFHEALCPPVGLLT